MIVALCLVCAVVVLEVGLGGWLWGFGAEFVVDFGVVL